jgi:hypothetical protein
LFSRREETDFFSFWALGWRPRGLVGVSSFLALPPRLVGFWSSGPGDVGVGGTSRISESLSSSSSCSFLTARRARAGRPGLRLGAGVASSVFGAARVDRVRVGASAFRPARASPRLAGGWWCGSSVTARHSGRLYERCFSTFAPVYTPCWPVNSCVIGFLTRMDLTASWRSGKDCRLNSH